MSKHKKNTGDDRLEWVLDAEVGLTIKSLWLKEAGITNMSIKRYFQTEPSNLGSSSSSSKPSKVDLDDLPWDPSESLPISSYHPSQKDEIRRAYLLRGEFGNWLEYSVKADKAYCLHCYLFKECGQNYAFLSEGVRCWNRAREKFSGHVGKCNSFHNKARKNGEALLNQAQSIPVALAFRGHDESEESLYRGNFIDNPPGNNQMTSPSIQKELCNCFAEEVLKKIFEELGDDVFSILVDESRDISRKEQMAVVLRYVDKLGFVKERFIGLVHVMETSALSLKSAIDKLFARHNLSIGRVRGQGYDGASNMSGEFNSLKALILKENPSTYFVHCFAHQLQPVVVALTTKHHEILKFFKEVSNLVNVVGASCKRIDLIRESQKVRLGLNPEVETGSGKNQELSLARAGDTRWSSHEKTIHRVLTLFPSVIDVLEYIENSGEISAHKSEAHGLQLT
ncbi:uncharacterized protein LOC143629961 [Bidens hawaiensis]|uniref:uncharacterized protein LOC143629961 n=1 Tax=Bidens hawaiensis TaxID=980011 RepID=UPI00404B39B7